MYTLRHLLPITALALNSAWIHHVDALVVTRNDTNLLPRKSPLTGDFAAFVKDNMDFWNIPGMAIAVIDSHDVFAEVCAVANTYSQDIVPSPIAPNFVSPQGYGFSALPDKKVTPETLFYAGSTTKAQTAACLSALVQNGSYPALAEGWSTTISSILKDDFVLQDQWATDHLTLDDAVSHRTGLPRHDRSLMREKDGLPLSTADIVRNMRNLPYIHEPRAEFHYCNYMYITLSHVIETVTKKSLKQVMKELIWDPLGMNSTYFGLEEAKQGPQDLATGYVWVNETGKHNETTYMPVTDLSGAAAVISNVRDYAKWIQALVNDTQVFSDDMLHDIRKPRMLSDPDAGKGNDVLLYGLGWYRSVTNGHVFYRHDGVMIGFRAQVYWFPNDKFGFVIFANSDEAAPANFAISWKLIADKFSIPVEELVDIPAGYVPPPPPPSLKKNPSTKKQIPQPPPSPQPRA